MCYGLVEVIVIEDIDVTDESNNCARNGAENGVKEFSPRVQRILRAQPLSSIEKASLTIPISFYDVIDNEVNLVTIITEPGSAKRDLDYNSDLPVITE